MSATQGTTVDELIKLMLDMEAQMSYASAQQDYYAALVEMERAIGTAAPLLKP